MTKRTVIDHKTGITSEFITEDNKDIFHTTQDVQPVIEHCKAIAENVKPGKDIRHVAEVPMVVYQKACREGWANDMARWRKWLNHSENKVFRTWQGKL
tara:strand:+ start:1228 stop:1521 length:294 start_codon:yes stop_codon:yes gene_type:complete